MKPEYSLIVPVFNETNRLYEGVTEILRFLDREKDLFELLVVDDGSVPEVVETIRNHKELARKLAVLAKKKQFRIIRLPENMGKGKAIAVGVREASGKEIIFSDVDCSVSPDVIPRFRKTLHRVDIAIGSRRLPESTIAVHQPWARESAGRIYTFLSNMICTTGVSDATCGLKAFRAPVAKDLFAKRKIDRWAFDTEILFLARTLGMTIEEVPVSWFNKSGSRVRLSDTVRAFVDLLAIRMRRE